ncbi:hypothetical protein N8133_01410 [bacterium]|nr:hypothetical protein [bacterium]
MKNCLVSFLGILAFASFSSYLHAQEYSTPVEYNEFDANIGVQQVAEVVHPWVGPTPQELAPGVIALGSLQDKKYIHQSTTALENELPIISTSIPPAAPIPIPGWVGQTPQELAPNAVPLGSLANRRLLWPISIQPFIEETPAFNVSIFASVRPYYSQNVLRVDGGKDGSFVTEAMLGASLSARGISLGQYVTMIPSLDLITQVAGYEDKEVSGLNLQDLLGYHFSLAKAGLKFQLPYALDLSLGYEYNLVRSLDTGSKMSDALAPSLRLSKSFILGESTLLMADGNLRYSFTDRVLPYPIPGQFADDGDNLQLGLSLSLVHLFGPEDRFMIMPSLNFSRSEYLKNENDGRVDWLTSIGLNTSWQMLDWLSLDLGLSYAILRMNDQGASTQGDSSKYEGLDIGLTVMAAHQF